MKYGLCLLFCLLMAITPVHGESYCVMSGDEETIIEEKDMHEKQSVASISKIMTAIIAIENGNLDDRWTLSDVVLSAHGSSVYLKPGQVVSLNTLLYGLMLRSGNDAALAIAEHVSGSEKAFVKLMNKKAKELGMKDTTFHNASGLDDNGKGNISSAFDMARCMTYAMNNPQFASIVKTKYYTNEMHNRWKNKNKLLFEFAFATGGKTGYTKQAGRTLVTSARNQTKETVVVTLGVANDFAFHKQKHQVAFDQLHEVVILDKGKYHAGNHTFVIDKKISVMIPAGNRTKIQTTASFHDDELIVKVIQNKHVKEYRFLAQSTKPTFWKQVISWI